MTIVYRPSSLVIASSGAILVLRNDNANSRILPRARLDGQRVRAGTNARWSRAHSLGTAPSFLRQRRTARHPRILDPGPERRCPIQIGWPCFFWWTMD